MKKKNLSKGITAEYNSLEELRASWNLPEIRKKTKDENKLKQQQEKFLNRHRCKACGEPMTYIGGNQMCCTNDKCPGIAHERKDKEGNVSVFYTTSYDLLDELGAEIANNIFN